MNEKLISVDISTIPLPDDVIVTSGTYTYSGKVLVSYNTESDIDTTDYINLAILNDDGTDFKVIFSGVIPTKERNGGIRYMPYRDNKRILLGDYVLECTPDIDNCTSTEIILVVYPSTIEDEAVTSRRWSEIIIAPDNIHIAWTSLLQNDDSAMLIGELARDTENYVIVNPKIISTTLYFEEDPENDGFIIPADVSRGGEVKQFVHGGNAISLVGAMRYVTTDSIVQSLDSENMTQITYTPGYDETTIFSPDEYLGIVMSSRFSETIDPAIFGIMPRPLYVGTRLNGILYYYTVQGARLVREGNLGPALIEIERSINEDGYLGTMLSTDENWVMRSPLSWHPDGKRTMWVEMPKGETDDLRLRLRKADLPDYEPQNPVPIVTTTDDIPYAVEDLAVLSSINSNVEGKIAGKHSGYMYYSNSSSSSISGETEAQYENYSDDGVNFYNGYEKYSYNYLNESRYEADIQLTGEQQGEMSLRATFSSITGDRPASLLFETDEDGNPKSYGYTTYNDTTLNIEDLSA